MSLAIERGDGRAQVLGVLAMLAMIVAVDQVVWRPLVAWSHKFTEEETPAPGSWLWDRVRRSRLWRTASLGLGRLRRYGRTARFRPLAVAPSAASPSPVVLRWLKRLLLALVGAGILFGAVRYAGLLATLTGAEWLHLARSTGATFGRVTVAVALATLWTVPAGVLIGRNPRWVRILQPVIQMAASFPAPMIFPVVVAAMLGLGAGLGTSSVVLLVLSTQWYILFNVIAGSSAIPADLWMVSRLARFPFSRRWLRLILPAIFPSLLTGWITALGGAWNASIVAEYMKFRGGTLSTLGLGAVISGATERGDFHVLGAAVGLMALTVVAFNRLVWRPLTRLAQTRFSMET